MSFVPNVLRGSLLLPALLGFGAAAAVAATADDLAARTVILVNSTEPESVALGEFYATQRGIPAANLVALEMPGQETVTWRTFVDQVWQPLQDQLLSRGWLDGIAGASLDRLGRRKVAVAEQHLAYLVVCRGTPLRIENDPTVEDEAVLKRLPAQAHTNQGAVDSELSLLAAGNYEVAAFLPNPLFEGRDSLGPAARLVVKVARLDGPSFADARGLVTSALAAERDGLLGRYYVDLRGPHPDGDRWLEEAQRQLEEAGFEGDVDSSTAQFDPAARFDAPVLYFGWCADSLNGPFANEAFRFPPGAIAMHIHSFSARTLHSTTEGWCGPLVARGVAATVGNVFEPYLQYTHRPDLLVKALIRGDTLGDAAYFALPVLSWQAVLIGDPLYRPFKVSLTEQRKRPNRLPPALAPYAVVRAARLLAHRGQSAEADALLQQEWQSFPSVVLALTRARLAVERKDDRAAVAALEVLGGQLTARPEDWALLREAAQFLWHHDAPGAALRIYLKLVGLPAPTREAQRALLGEARAAADAAGDAEHAREFQRSLDELSPPIK